MGGRCGEIHADRVRSAYSIGNLDSPGRAHFGSRKSLFWFPAAMNMIEPGQSVVCDPGRLPDSATGDVAVVYQGHHAPDARRLSASVTIASVPNSSGLLAVGRESTRLFTQRERTNTGLAQGG